MQWYNSIGTLEIIFVALFIGLYAAYVFRLIRISSRLGSPFKKVFIKAVLRTVYFGLFIFALLGPSFGKSTREVKSVGKDIFIAVDLSRSMNAFDIQPTRLEKVKFELKNLIDAFHSDRIGLIIFSSEAFIQSPLTFDQNALNLFIETLHTGLVPDTGTDFGPPLRMALKKLTSEESITQQKSKVIILISDGEDFGENTEDVANEIKEEDIKVFTLGVGTEQGSRIRTANGFKKDRNGNDVISKLNRSSLESLASQTNGDYFEINASRNDVSRLINTITEIEGEMRDARQIDVSANKYFYFLGLALVLLLLDSLLKVKTVKI